MYALFTIFVLFATALLPLWVRPVAKLFGITRFHSAPSWLPVAAGLVFFASFFLPDIHISVQTSTFQQHFVGGGFYVALLYVYCKQLFGWRLNALASLAVLFAWASAFGVANELLEFTLNQLNITAIELGDADWDLLANTLGAFVGYGLLCLARVEKLR